MSSFIINFTNTSGEKGSVIPDLDFNYSDKLNDMNEAKINISGTSEAKRSLIEEGSTFEIKRNGTIELSGEVIGISYLDGGAVSARCMGAEFEMTKDHGDYLGSPWQLTASKTIFQEVIGEFNLFSLGTVETGFNIDFRAIQASSYMNVIQNLQSKTNQDRSIDYAAVPFDISILDHKGSSTSVATLNDGIHFSNLQVDRGLPKGNKIIVYGKGDGENQIKSEYPAHGQNSSSQTTFGIITLPERDPTIISVDEANTLADVLAAANGVATKTYRFDLTNPSQSFVSGDVITLNSRSKNLNNEEVRIVGIERGQRGGQEYMTLQVTSKEYSNLLKTRDRVIGEIQRNNRDDQTYMQGTTNVLTFSQQINATSTAPLRTQGNLPTAFITDEAGNLRINSFTCDYDVDPFRSSVGTASESDVAPGVAGTSSSEEGQQLVDSDSSSLVTLDTGFDIVANIDSGSQFTGLTSNIVLKYQIYEVSGGPEDIQIRITNTYPSLRSWVIDIPALFQRSIGSIEVGDFTTSTGHDLRFDARYVSGAISVGGELKAYSSNHNHGDGTYSADSHNHSVSVGDDVSDAGSINATEVSIYVDHWSGSSWVQKHSILNTGKTIDTDVDISDGGTLPDAGGYWRTRILTDNSNADLVNSIMKVKHELDT